MKPKSNAILFCFFGNLGIHRSYLGQTLIGIIQLLNWDGFLIWQFVNFIRLKSGSLKDYEGNDLVKISPIDLPQK